MKNTIFLLIILLGSAFCSTPLRSQDLSGQDAAFTDKTQEINKGILNLVLNLREYYNLKYRKIENGVTSRSDDMDVDTTKFYSLFGGGKKSQIINIFHPEFLLQIDSINKYQKAGDNKKIDSLYNELKQVISCTPEVYFEYMQTDSMQAAIYKYSADQTLSYHKIDPELITTGKGFPKRKYYRYSDLRFSININSHGKILGHDDFSRLGEKDVRLDVIVSFREKGRAVDDFRIDNVILHRPDSLGGTGQDGNYAISLSFTGGSGSCGLDTRILLPDSLRTYNGHSYHGGLNVMIESNTKEGKGIVPAIQLGIGYSSYSFPMVLNSFTEAEPMSRDTLDNYEKLTDAYFVRHFTNVRQSVNFSELVFTIGFLCNWYLDDDRNTCLFGDFNVCPSLPLSINTTLEGGNYDITGVYMFDFGQGPVPVNLTDHDMGYGEKKIDNLTSLTSKLGMGISLRYGAGIRFNLNKNRTTSGFIRLGFQSVPLMHNYDILTGQRSLMVENNQSEISNFSSQLSAVGLRSSNISLGLNIRIK